MKPPRGLSAAEAELWKRVTATVVPLHPPRGGKGEESPRHGDGEVSRPVARPAARPGRVPPASPPPPPPEHRGKTPPLSPDRGLDNSWERKLAKAAIAPDFTLDLHGHTLEQAHRRLDAGLMQAKAMEARLVLLITGKARPAAAADRGSRRGAIRAKVLDWLAAGPHAGDIAAVRPAHRRHGGEGAVYLILKRRR